MSLRRDSWDDFGYRTLFQATFHPSSGDPIELGGTKVASSAPRKRTELPEKFDSLDETYFSLGQSLDYYRAISSLPKKQREELLVGLRDAVFQPQIRERYSSLDVFQTSLLRFSEAEKTFHEARLLFGETPDVEASGCVFRFSVQLKQSGVPHVLNVALGNSGLLPDRILALIGKNGTGKTWLLGRLAAALSGDERDEQVAGSFTPFRPAFTRVIAVSYSAFDRFNRPNRKRTFSYKYCGIYDADGRLHSRLRLLRKVRESFHSLNERGRAALWLDTIKAVLGEDVALSVGEYVRSGKSAESGTPRLSSGQLVLVSTVTEMLASIEGESFILFDEPEMHLHPNAVAGLMKALHRILEAFSSFAVVATHSPLVVQQVPSAYVRLFVRIGNVTTISEPIVESFGENLTSLTQELFQVNASPSLYRDWLRDMVDASDEDQVAAAFPKGLSFNALSVLQSLGQ